MIFPFLLAVLGAIVGSFLATLVIRWPEKRSVATGRSACDACGRILGVRDLVPLLSALATRNRCRHCGARIDAVHWRVEFGCAAVGLAAGLSAPPVEAVAGASFGWLLLTLASLDLRHFWLPDRLTGVLALGGLSAGAAGLSPELGERLIGGAAGFGGLWLIAAAYRAVRGREGMGGGDPKLFGAIGLWLGWRMLPPVLLLASMIGLGVVLFQHMRGRPLPADHALPFGALLAAAAYPAWLAMVTLAP